MGKLISLSTDEIAAIMATLFVADGALNQEKFEALRGSMDERSLVAGAEADAVAYGRPRGRPRAPGSRRTR